MLALDRLLRGDPKVKTYRVPVLNPRFNEPTVILSFQIAALLYFLIRLIDIVG